MTFDAKAFREEAVEAVARVIDPLAFEPGTARARGWEGATDAEIAKMHALRQKHAKAVARRQIAALSAVARQHGVKMLGREPTDEMCDAWEEAAPTVDDMRRAATRDTTSCPEQYWREMWSAAISVLEE